MSCPTPKLFHAALRAALPVMISSGLLVGILPAKAQNLIVAPQALLTNTYIHEAATTQLLPEAPSAILASSSLSNADSAIPEPTASPLEAKPNQPHVAALHDLYIPAGWTAQKITAHDKVLIGLKDLYSPFTFMGIIASAGYAHVLNGEPNYGTDKGAFGERLGAAGLRDTSEGVFTNMVLAPILHEDPRYYVQGPDHNFFERILYSVTRVIITRTDSGRTTINGATLLGYAGASAISYSYYPAINQNFHDTVGTYGGALGGAAFGYFVSEFSDEVLQFLHLEKR